MAKPVLNAQSAAWVLLVTSNLLKILLTCLSTVRSVTISFWAISLLENPPATSLSTSASRSVIGSREGDNSDGWLKR